MSELFTQELSWRMRAAESTVELGSILREQFKKIGVSKFTYVGLYPAAIEERAYIDTTYPEEWVARYHNEDYYFADPMVMRAQTTLIPFQWGPDHKLDCQNKRQDKIINESSEFGHHQGINIPIRGSNGEFAFVVLVTDRTRKKKFDSFFNEYVNGIHLSCLYYHYYLWNILRKNKMDLLPEIPPHQISVLRLASSGKTAWEISKIMHLSEAGVRYHIQHVSKKLGTFGVTATVTKAIALGYFSP